MLHGARADEMLDAIVRTDLDIRPRAIGTTWEQVGTSLEGMRAYVNELGLWHSIAHDRDITGELVGDLRERLDAAYASAER